MTKKELSARTNQYRQAFGLGYWATHILVALYAARETSVYRIKKALDLPNPEMHISRLARIGLARYSTGGIRITDKGKLRVEEWLNDVKSTTGVEAGERLGRAETFVDGISDGVLDAAGDF